MGIDSTILGHPKRKKYINSRSKGRRIRGYVENETLGTV